MNEKIINKDSLIYFMTEMTQKEFEERNKDLIKCIDFKFNRIQPECSKREDLIEMIVAPEPDSLTKKRLEENSEFLSNCAGINSDLLGCSTPKCNCHRCFKDDLLKNHYPWLYEQEIKAREGKILCENDSG